MLFACRQTYQTQLPPRGTPVGWTEPPQEFIAQGPHGAGNIDRALVGRVAEGIVLAFRGTLAPFVEDDHGSGEVARDWLNNVEFLSRDNTVYPGRVHAGFAGSVERLWGQVAPAIQGLIRPGGPNRLYVTGHSKGGALANLAGWRALGIVGLEGPIRVLTIAAARCGNEDFRTAYQAHGGISCRRYESAADVVPLVPPGADTPSWAKLLIQRLWPRLTNNDYVPVGTRVPVGVTLLEGLQVARRYLGGFGFGSVRSDYLPLLALAHDISPNSGYDTLICDGDPGCTHD
ncbi:MAG TPA: lipase family protein [Allosphingosinicella sp.]|nr:lipase family protein [Allosphingosinicella sp.]